MRNPDSGRTWPSFLGPAILLLALFFLLPVMVDVFVAFTDMDGR
ncbi:MAG: hypothetical protein R3C70_17955 [Geminicoccaceae bacterium]